tara:strand:+ start:433 stop:1272 length:840 start_codon:yes stop_codon:yes gene_type:complete
MEMSWDKLADRCLLFTEANKGMLIELLKEAEEELGRKCTLFEGSWAYSIPLDSRSYYVHLPDEAVKVNTVLFDGSLLKATDDADFPWNSSNSVDDGTPSRYMVRRGLDSTKLYLDKKPSSGNLTVKYSASRAHISDKQFVNKGSLQNAFFLVSDLGSALNGLSGNWWDADNPAGNYFNSIVSAGYDSTRKFNKWTATMTGLDDTPLTNAIIEIYNYHSVAPMIPEQYQKDLCHYAVSVASSKSNPQLSDKHLMLWEKSINEIIAEDADKDLIHQIRSEI